MTDTTVNDAVVFPQDDGTGVPNEEEDYASAAFIGLLAKAAGDKPYVGTEGDGTPTLQFQNVDTSNNQVDIGPGYAYVTEGGNSVQSGSQNSYDTTFASNTEMMYVVALPTSVTNLGLDAGQNDVWLFIEPGTNETVKIRHGGGLSEPSNPSVKIGSVDANDGSTGRVQDGALVAQDVSRNAQGQVQFQQSGIASVTATQAATPVSARVQGSGRVMYDRMEADITTGAGTMSLKRNGVTQVSGSPPLSTSGSPRIDSPTWTVSAVFTSIPTITVDSTTGSLDENYEQTLTTKKTLTGTGATLYARGDFSLLTNGTAAISVGGVVKTSVTGATDGTALTTTLNGVYTSPVVTWRATGYNPDGAFPAGRIYTHTARLKKQTASADFIASENQVVDIE